MASSRRLRTALALDASFWKRRRTSLFLIAAAGIALALALSQQNAHARHRAGHHQNTLQSHGGARPKGRPNIVFVLTDDLSLNLLQFMPHVQAMQRSGMTFNNYFVSDSLCCPSRSSILTGDFPHNTGVFTNFGSRGGFQTFYNRGNERRTFALALKRSGYLTAMMGKYLNGYGQSFANSLDGGGTTVPPTYVPPGWSEWDVAGWGYPEFNYTMNENGRLHSYGSQPSDYLTDVLASKGNDFVGRAARSHKPFFLELATFAPHSPYVPAPRDASAFPGLHAPQPPTFDRTPFDAPRWLSQVPPLTGDEQTQLDSTFRLRAQSVRAVDNLIGRIERALREQGVAGNTYIVFSSDNGLHTGEYRLMPGKLTAFDTDIHVPLVVTGPGVQPSSATNKMVENVDLAETFARIGHTTLHGDDGRSLLGLIQGAPVADWRDAVLIEHRGKRQAAVDPDLQPPLSGKPPTYEAIRTWSFLYVEYVTGEREFYDLRSDPNELYNLAGALGPHELALLHRTVRVLKHCRGSRACWRAAHIDEHVAP